MQHIAIVGAGAAGARCAERVRSLGFTGDLTVIGAEKHLPYDRPPLSKGALTTASFDTTLPLDYAGLGVDIRLGEPVRTISERSLVTDRGELRFDGAIIATGAEARTLPAVEQHGNVHYLRTVDDASRLRRQLAADQHVVVVGAGWIGAEVASTAAALGAMVTVVERTSAPAASLPHAVARHLVPWFERAGVRLILGVGVSTAEDRAIVLQDGRRIRADVVVVGVGGAPAVSWLAGSPFKHDGRGICVDSSLRTNVPGVVAAGDVVCYPSVAADRRLTIAHRDDAYASAEVAARSLLDPTSSALFDPVPYFWSEQFGKMIQFAGWISPEDEIVWRGDPHSGDWAVCWLQGSTLRAVLTVDRPRDLARARRLIGQQHTLTARDVNDPARSFPSPAA